MLLLTIGPLAEDEDRHARAQFAQVPDEIEPLVPGMTWSVTMIFTSARERAEKGECLLGRAGAGDAGFAQHGFADASCVWLSSIKRT
jgi:hypothetical protein